jgi:putative mRNA 3-end processing factor
MNVSFQYANRSNTSILLKFDGILNNQTVCLLVDAGEGVDVDSLIDEDENEYLTGILLTHLHLDHYSSLEENLRDGAKIYTSKENEKILDTVLFEANSNAEQKFDTHSIQAAVTSIPDSVTIGNSLTITPVPAGHTPGATAFYLEFETGTETESILITGDFTRWKVAGYPGLPLHDTDTLILTGASSNNFRDSITDAMDDTLQQGVSGSPTLVTASGLNCVHFTYLLSHVIEEYSQSLQVNIVGQAAKLYDALNYDLSNVRSVQQYEPNEVVDAGCITVSGPDIPNSGGSKLLFDEIRDDPNAGLIQLISSNRGEIAESRCTTNQYVLVNHPSMETIKNTVELLDPKQVVVTHQTGDDLERYRDQFPTIVWAPKSNKAFNLYEDGEWSPPHWVSDSVIRKFSNDSQTVTLSEVDPSSVTFQRTGVDLEEEGLYPDRLTQFSENNDRDNKYSTTSPPEPEPDTAAPDPETSQSRSGKEVRTDGAATQPAGGKPTEPGPSPSEIEQTLSDIESSIDSIEEQLKNGPDIRARTVHVDSETIILKTDENQELPYVGESVVLKRVNQ